MITIKIDTGLTTEGDQTNTNHHRNQPKAQIIFKYTDQNMMEIMQTVRGFINFMKVNCTTRDQFKSNKLTMHKEYNNEVNKSEIRSSSLD